jgi:4'-phosphopantetheinyl transferase
MPPFDAEIQRAGGHRGIGLTNTSLRLGGGRVDVWLASLQGVSRDLERRYLRLLSDAERARWQRFAAQDAQLQYLVSRALVRATLSRYANVLEHAWRFETNRYGRPHVSWPQQSREIQFNLSTTTGLVVCAVTTDCDVGIDVENIARILDTDTLAPTVFAAAELADFRRHSPGDRRDRFFAYWTLKEAYIKARGMGLSIPLDAFWFDLGDPSPLLHVTDRCRDDPERWNFRQYAPTAEHRMAVAVAAPRGAQPSIHLRWITPTSAGSDIDAARCDLQT